MRAIKSIAFTVVILAAAACGTEADVDTQAGHASDDALPLDGQAILDFLNGPDATLAVLMQEAGVKSRAAGNIFEHVRGPDRQLGTADDDKLDSIAELDAIPYVGTATLAALDAYVRSRGYQPDFTLEGVPFTLAEAAGVLQLANGASQAALDDDVGLDARAARNIVAARPLATIQLLAAVSYVNGTALQRMKDWVLTHGTPPPPVDRTPAVIVSAAATDSSHVVVTYSKAIDQATSRSDFQVFISDPDSPLGVFDVVVNGAELTIETDAQEPGTDYTVEAAQTVRDAGGTPVDPNNGRWVHFDGFTPDAPPPPPPPGEVDCSTLLGGTFDATAFTAAEECSAVRFLNRARFSEMEQLSDAGRHIAYDCGPSGACGFRSSAWQRLAQFSDTPTVGATALAGLKADSAGWSANGLGYDTVAGTWQNRASLVDHPVHFEAVTLTRRRADQAGQYITYKCAEARDQDGAPNFLTVCMAQTTDTYACGTVDACLNAAVGTRVSLRGAFRTSAQSAGGYRVTLSELPSGANPAVP